MSDRQRTVISRIPAIGPLAPRHGRLEPIALAALVAVVLTFFLADLASLPMRLWDESRLAVNAAEMAASGNHLVTTYGFAPDLWNTKPPLLINLIALSFKLFGFNTFALRLPSALAAFATVVAVMVFVRSITRSLGWGLVAGLVLGESAGFYGFHAGQTGDYDALLTLLTTVYGVLLFVLFDGERRRPWLAVGIGVLVGLAILTKGIAGIIPGIGCAVYALLFARQRLLNGWREFASLAAVAVLIGGSFYAARSWGDPSYMAAVWVNELGGRYATVLDRHVGSKLTYLRQLLLNVPGTPVPAFAVTGAAAAALAAPWLTTGRQRRAALFALCQAAAVVVVYSSAATKISWYIEPALPFLAILLTLAIAGAAARLARSSGLLSAAAHVAIALGLLAIAGQAVFFRYVQPVVPEATPRAYRQLFAAAQAAQAWPLTVVDGGYGNDAGIEHYAPMLRFYTLAAGRDGHRAQQATRVTAASQAHAVGSCDPSMVPAVAALGQLRWTGSGCILVIR